MSKRYRNLKIEKQGNVMIVYIHPKCTTCKNAMKFLQSRQCVVKDITTTPPSRAELERMLKFYNGNIRKLFNTSGQLYRELGLATKTLSDDEALQMLSENGMLVKRPFLIGGDIGLVGFNEAAWKTL
jgi:Spx/MgsR family transcriptional regulator